MRTPKFVLFLIVTFTLAYMGGLAVSTAHLAQLFALFNGTLPYLVSLGLAVALEVVAFLMSIATTSLGKDAGPWAAWGSSCALVLVWAGNGYAMYTTAPTKPLIVTIGASCFVPVCTLFVGKVLGSLFKLLDTLREEKAARDALAKTTKPPVAAPAVIVERPHTPPLSSPVVPAMAPDTVTASRVPDSMPDDAPGILPVPPTPRPVSPANAPSNPATPSATFPVSPTPPQAAGFAPSNPAPSPATPSPILHAQVQAGVSTTPAPRLPPDVSGVQFSSDAALLRVKLDRAELQRLTGILDALPRVGPEPKLKAEQRALAWKYSLAGAANTALAKELDCDESTLRAAVRRVGAAMNAAGVKP